MRMWKRREVLTQVDVHICMNYSNGNQEGRLGGGQAYEQGYEYINRHRDIGVYWMLQEKRRENRKLVMNIEQNTKHAARTTPEESQVEKKAYTHDTDSQQQANRQGMCVRETIKGPEGFSVIYPSPQLRGEERST